ncbi:unnamed protein product [marine sediment metagenome]|uniref:Uncharacterized protein n=1 Tax=marine sediment metagenome TaxID=412755 RepID=X1FH71_9ZZZZ
MPELEIVNIEITAALPEEGVIDRTYRIEGTVKVAGVGAPPWVYAETKRKEWYKPEIVEEVSYERGFPMPISGEFKIDWKPKKTGIYDVTIVATPAPLSLPVIGVPPIFGESDMMKFTAVEKPEAGLEILACSFA